MDQATLLLMRATVILEKELSQLEQLEPNRALKNQKNRLPKPKSQRKILIESLLDLEMQIEDHLL
jgi:hypothetical protein